MFIMRTHEGHKFPNWEVDATVLGRHQVSPEPYLNDALWTRPDICQAGRDIPFLPHCTLHAFSDSMRVAFPLLKVHELGTPKADFLFPPFAHHRSSMVRLLFIGGVIARFQDGISSCLSVDLDNEISALYVSPQLLSCRQRLASRR